MKDNKTDLVTKVIELLNEFDPEEFCKETSGDRAERLSKFIVENLEDLK